MSSAVASINSNSADYWKFINSFPSGNGKAGYGRRFFRKQIRGFSPSFKEFMLATSLSAGLSQIFQEFNYAFIPKAVNALAIRHSWSMVVYEFLLEASEYLGLFLFPTGVAALFSKWCGKRLEIPNWRLIGEKTWKLEKSLNKEYSIDGFKTKIDKQLLNKVSFAKFMTFLAAAGSGAAAQIIATAPRALLAKTLFHTDNFYVISGLPVPDGEVEGSKESKKAEKNAWKNLIGGFLYIAFSIPILMSLTNKFGNKLREGKTFNRLSKHFDMDPKFGISKTLTAFILAFSPYAYLSVAFNKAEKLENAYRLIFLAIPEVIFFKQMIGNGLSWLTGQLMGVGNILMPVRDAIKEAKEGKRDCLYWSLVKDDHIKSLEKYKKLDKSRQEKVLKTVNFMNEWAVYGMAMAFGFFINWINYLRTKKMDEAEAKTAPSNNSVKEVSQAFAIS
ncbi:MAG: hypothetical protein QNJ31_03225 [Candidatus Caenarcaniphilales bacterium]|nr:hypothetical protein [Candidatus Caenarcaniphilales bacterium]